MPPPLSLNLKQSYQSERNTYGSSNIFMDIDSYTPSTEYFSYYPGYQLWISMVVFHDFAIKKSVFLLAKETQMEKWTNRDE